jgi:integrase
LVQIVPELAIKTGTKTGTTFMVDVDTRIAQANGRLKAGKIRVRIKRRGDTLSLRATLPPPPGGLPQKDGRYVLALGVSANPAGVQFAESKARLLGAELQNGKFDWGNWVDDEQKLGTTVADWVQRFTREFQPTLNPETWKTDYHNVFAKLPGDAVLTVDLLREKLLSVQSANPNSRQQRRFALALERLGKYAGLEVDFSHLRGNYSASEVEPRDIPSDELIAKHFHEISDPGWRWVYGMVATFGLRSHEVFYLDTEELQEGGYMVVVKEGKTGRRLVWACYPEWVEAFDLRSPQLPAVTAAIHTDYTRRWCGYFQERLPFTGLDLRHAWAIRTLECGVPYALAAMQMGHSVAVHERTYHRWITKETHQKAFDAVMWRSDRPRPQVNPKLAETLEHSERSPKPEPL